MDSEDTELLLRWHTGDRAAEELPWSGCAVGEILLNGGKLAGARAAFAAVPADDPWWGAIAAFAGHLLRRELAEAGAKMAAIRDTAGGDGAHAMATSIAVAAAHQFQELGEADMADSVLSMAAESGHERQKAAAYTFLGALRADADDHDGALEAWEHAARAAAPAWDRDALDAGCLRHERGDLDTAEKWYRRVMGTGDEELARPARYHLARLCQTRGETDAARALAGDPGQERARAALAAAYVAAGAGAVSCAEAAYADAMTSTQPHLVGRAAAGLGVLRQRRGDLDGAAAAYRAAAANGDPETRAVALHNLGEVYAEQGDLAAARQWFEEAIAQASTGGNAEVAARAAYNLGIRLEAAGDRAGALAAYDRAQTFDVEGVAVHARRRAGTETALERGLRLANEDLLTDALAALTEAYGSAAVAAFALAVYCEDMTTARAAFADIVAAGGPDHAAAISAGTGLAASARGGGHFAVAQAALELVTGIGGDAVTPGGQAAADDVGEATEEAAHELIGLLTELDDAEALARISVRLAEASHTDLAVLGFAHLGDRAALEQGQFAEAARWYECAAAVPGTPHAARFQLAAGRVWRRAGDLSAAAGRFEEALRVGDPALAGATAFELGGVRYQQGELLAAAAAWASAAACAEPGGSDKSGRFEVADAVTNVLAAARELDEAGRYPDAAAVLRGLGTAGHRAPAAAAAGRYAAGRSEADDRAGEIAYLEIEADFADADDAALAGLRLGSLRERGGDEHGAEQAWQAAAYSGDGRVATFAALRMYLLDDARGDVAAARRWLERVVHSPHEDLAGEARYFLGTMPAPDQ